MPSADPPLHTFILKVASRCNLDCSYCYVFNKGDETWRTRPPLMSEETYRASLRRIREHVERSGQRSVTLTFHGGEPTLLGAQTFRRWTALAREALAGVATPRFNLQTNGTLLDDAWARALREADAQVGVSMDGPKAVHDAFRVDHAGRGSYDDVLRGLRTLRAHGVPFGILSVIPLGGDPLAVHRHFVGLGCDSVSYLLPDFTHETIGRVRARHGPTPCADFLIPVFDDWWENGTMDVRIQNFWQMARIILGGASATDTFGAGPLAFVVVETDGDIEGLDVLRVCRDGLTHTGLNVRDAGFGDLARLGGLHAQVVFHGMPTPAGCRACPERETCGGGYLPHRYSEAAGFDNPSVWCADILKLFAHIRARLDVDPHETALRRQALREVGPAAAAP